MVQTMDPASGQGGNAADSIQSAPSSLGIFTTNNHTQLANLNGPHRYSDALAAINVEPEGTGDMNAWKWRADQWTLEGLYYYEAQLYDNEVVANNAVSKPPGGVHKPIGPMPENVAYIWADRARVYCKDRPALPAPDDNNYKLAHRDVVSLHNAGYTLKEIGATVPRPPAKSQNIKENDPGKEPRDGAPRLGGRISERDQKFRERIGTFSPVIREQDSVKSENVYGVLQYKSFGNLFHGVLGTIDPFKFKWSPPQDPFHTSPDSNVQVFYDLPPPHDISEYDRKRIDRLREERGLKPLPSFTKFLNDCAPTFARYFLNTYKILRSPNVKQHFKREQDVLDSIEEERISRWAEIKGWSGEEVAAANNTLLSVVEKASRRLARKRKGSGSSSPLASIQGKRARAESHGEGTLGLNMSHTARTLNQHARRQSTGGAMPARDTGFNSSPPQQFHSSPLRQVWSSPLANVRGHGTATFDQGSHYSANQFDRFNGPPTTPDRSGAIGGHFHQQGQVTTPTGGPYSTERDSPSQFARPGAWDSSFSMMDSSTSRPGHHGNHPSMGPAPPPPRYNPLNSDGTGAVGNTFARPLSYDQQHRSTQTQAPPYGYNLVHAAAGPNHPSYGTRLMNPEELDAALSNYRQETSGQADAFNRPSVHSEGMQAPGHGNVNAFQDGFASQVHQQSTGNNQQQGSHNVVVQVQNNFNDPTQVANGASTAQDSAVPNDGGGYVLDPAVWLEENTDIFDDLDNDDLGNDGLDNDDLERRRLILEQQRRSLEQQRRSRR
ncbi:hypothetical protein Vi05172_g4751 [Venturia inaequalis]|nr:hypothetical protein Vi05172_g4751 [Venturia inaequalis]